MLMKLDSDSTPAMTKVAVVSTISRSLSRSPSISASARWVIRSSVGLARRTATSAVRKSLNSLKAAMCSGVRPFAAFIGRDREDHLAPDVGVVARRQPHAAEQKPDGDLAGKVVDELEFALRDDALKRAVGDVQRRLDHAVEIALEERGLAQCAQPVVARRIGGSERRAGAAGQFVDHVALRGREGLPVARRFDDVVVARQDPKLRALAPVAGIFFAQRGVIGERIGVDGRRIEVERLQRFPRSHFLEVQALINQ